MIWMEGQGKHYRRLRILIYASVTIPLKQNLKNYFHFNLVFYIISDLQKDIKYDTTDIHVPITQLKQYYQRNHSSPGTQL